MWGATMNTTAPFTGCLLVASTRISQGCFRRGVIYLVEHTDEGSWGVMLNKPTSAPAHSLCPALGSALGRQADIYYGGPVGLDTGIGLAVTEQHGEQPDGVHHIMGGIALVDLHCEDPHVSDSLWSLRIFAGYAGWEAKQLDEELAEGSWYVCPALQQDVGRYQHDGHWAAVLKRQPPPLGWYATFPENPGDN